jgi:hypothetical protein
LKRSVVLIRNVMTVIVHNQSKDDLVRLIRSIGRLPWDGAQLGAASGRESAKNTCYRHISRAKTDRHLMATRFSLRNEKSWPNTCCRHISRAKAGRHLMATRFSSRNEKAWQKESCAPSQGNQCYTFTMQTKSLQLEHHKTVAATVIRMLHPYTIGDKCSQVGYSLSVSIRK